MPGRTAVVGGEQQAAQTKAMNGNQPLSIDIKRYFRDQFREARAASLRDAEGFQQILFSLERLGGYLCKQEKGRGLGAYKPCIESVIASPGFESYTTAEFETTYEIVRQGRNDALHQGAFARHLTANAVKLALMLGGRRTSGKKLHGRESSVCRALAAAQSPEAGHACELAFVPASRRAFGGHSQMAIDF